VPVSDDRQQSRIQESKQERKQEGKQEGKQENIQAKTIGKNSSSNEDRIRQLEKTVELLLTKLSSLESEVKSLKGKNSQSQTQSQYQTADEFDYEEVVEEIQIPKKRLLR
jgi:predicted transposase YdaD